MSKRVRAGGSKLAVAARRAKFIEAYIANKRNGTEAAITAGFSPNGASVIACRLLAEPKIQQAIAERQAAVLAAAEVETGISVTKTLREVGRLSYVDVSKCFDQHGNALEISEIPEDVRACISGFELVEEFEMVTVDGVKHKQHKGYVKKFKFFDKNAALDKLMKHFGQYKEDNVQQPPVLPPVIHVVGVRAR